MPRFDHAQSTPRWIGYPQREQMPIANIPVGRCLLLGRAATADQMSRVYMRLKKAPHRKIADADVDQNASQLVGEMVTHSGRCTVLRDRQWQSQRARCAQCRNVLGRKHRGVIVLRGTLLHRWNQRGDSCDDIVVRRSGRVVVLCD
ncbi:MAG TPA: hypothetical protein VMQ99_23725 [Acetobacteraceae bacterium]|nr:hypothetical protein [Acetobacteraceae bacterium]